MGTKSDNGVCNRTWSVVYSRKSDAESLMLYYAHSGLTADLAVDGQPLTDHLRGVASCAATLASRVSADPALIAAAHAAGWLHDLGKYRPEFQLYLRGLRAGGPLTHHKQAGAVPASDGGNECLAAVILGHHGGLPDLTGVEEGVEDPDRGRQVYEACRTEAERDTPELAGLEIPLPPDDPLAADLYARLVFSCLVDADWTDTRQHEQSLKKEPAEPEPPPMDADTWLGQVLTKINDRAAGIRDKNPALARTRDDILQACLTGAERPPGLFTLTVPTGGGKTLSGLAFALKHICCHNPPAGRPRLRRVIYVAPYLSILEQNADAIRDALGFDRGSPEVFEHHSLAEPPGDDREDETARSAAARRAENWDAPIVVTTSVQFYESLFSNKPGRCRKLHNIAGSVILLDECQTLPPDLVGPTCGMLKQLVDQLGCSVVLCTATQPAFGHETLKENRLTATEIIPAELNLFDRLRRVELAWPKSRDEVMNWPAVAERMGRAPAALCVVNTRKAALDLFRELAATKPADAVFHLSTGMCPAHRREVLATVKERLPNRECFVASTQLIEAGVDIDLPVVMREMAPLEAVIQAAGRCNREGLLPNHGRVEVFRSVDKRLPPDEWYRAGRDAVETVFLAAGREPRIDAPEDIQKYYGHLYWRKPGLDPKNIIGSRRGGDFPAVAGKYWMIEETVPVVVATWDGHREEVEALIAAAKRTPTRANFRKLIPFQVNLRRHEIAKANLKPEDEKTELYIWRGGYDPRFGLTADNADALLMY